MRQIAIHLSIIFMALSYGSMANAEDYHHQSFVLGERGSGMGGAFTSLANDSAASYYNPARLALIDSSSLSLSANLYGLVNGT